MWSGAALFDRPLAAAAAASFLQAQPENLPAIADAPFKFGLLKSLLRSQPSRALARRERPPRFATSREIQEPRKLPRARFRIPIPKFVSQVGNGDRPAGDDFQLDWSAGAKLGETFEITSPIHSPLTHRRPLQHRA